MNLEWNDFKLCDSVLDYFLSDHFNLCFRVAVGLRKFQLPTLCLPLLFSHPFYGTVCHVRGGAEAPAARLKFDIGILLPFGNLMDFSLWDFYVRISLAWHSSTIAAKSGLAFCPSVLHFSFTFVFVSNSVFVWRLFRLGSALVILFPFRLFEKGQLRYDSIWG